MTDKQLNKHIAEKVHGMELIWTDPASYYPAEVIVNDHRDWLEWYKDGKFIYAYWEDPLVEEEVYTPATNDTQAREALESWCEAWCNDHRQVVIKTVTNDGVQLWRVCLYGIHLHLDGYESTYMLGSATDKSMARAICLALVEATKEQ